MHIAEKTAEKHRMEGSGTPRTAAVQDEECFVDDLLHMLHMLLLRPCSVLIFCMCTWTHNACSAFGCVVISNCDKQLNLCASQKTG